MRPSQCERSEMGGQGALMLGVSAARLVSESASKVLSQYCATRQLLRQWVMTTIGYARVSTDRQSLDQQRDALNAAGVERIFTDKRSGARDDREGLAALLDYARAGDVVVVVALDRLGRSLSGIIRTVETLLARDVHLRSLRESIDTTTAVGHMLIGIFGSLAQYERTLINERSAAAREAARARGKAVGRPKALTTDQARQVRALRDAGEAVPALCATFGVSRASVYRALAEETP